MRLKLLNSEPYASVYAYVCDHHACGAKDICEATGLDIRKVAGALRRLHLEGLVRPVGRMRRSSHGNDNNLWGMS